MEEKMRGIVLGGVSVGDNDKILNVFTLEKGVVSAKIKGVKKAGAKLKFAAEPFCFAEFVFMKTADKRTVIGASLIDSFYPLREDLKKYFAAGTVLEFVKRFEKESMVSADDFLLAVNALGDIAYGDDPFVSLVEYLIEALRSAGYALKLDGCFKCGNDIDGRTFFDYRSGAFYGEDCFDGTGREIHNGTFKALARAECGEMMSGDEFSGKALKLLDYYIKNRAEEKLNSLEELIKTFIG
jgi:DNA repair protein RecO (recombination protein O)